MSKSDFQSPECCSSCSDSVAETLSSCEGIFHDCWMAWLLLASGIRPQTPLTRIPYLLFPSACFIHSPCLSPQPASLHFCHLPPPGFVYFPSSFNQHHQSIRAQSVPFTVNGKRCWMRPVPCDEYSHSTIEILFVVLSSLRSLKHIAALQAPSSPSFKTYSHTISSFRNQSSAPDSHQESLLATHSLLSTSISTTVSPRKPIRPGPATS